VIPIATKKLGIFWVALVIVFAVVDFFPIHGPPFFRYTGADPKHHVWNLGWPIAWSIYDEVTPPFWFTTPVFLPALLMIQFIILMAGWLLPLFKLRRRK